MHDERRRSGLLHIKEEKNDSSLTDEKVAREEKKDSFPCVSIRISYIEYNIRSGYSRPAQPVTCTIQIQTALVTIGIDMSE